MKILSAEPLAKRLSGVMGELIGRRDGHPQKIMHKKLAAKDQYFLTWPALSSRHISALAGFNQRPQLRLKVLEQFLHKSTEIEEQYFGLMASALLRDTLDDRSEARLSKAKAVQQMVQLIKTSVGDIRTVALLNISSSKG